MTTPLPSRFLVDEEAPPSRGYLNAAQGMSGIGRAMRDKYMAQQAAESMMRRPVTPDRPDAEDLMRRMPRPPDEVYKKGGKVKKYKGGGSVSSASKRADGIAQRGKTRGRFV